MTEFLIIIGLVDLLVLLGLFAVMRTGRAHDLASEAQARALWASRQRVRLAAPIPPPAQPGTDIAGRKAFDAHGTVLGVASEFFYDPADGTPQWLEVQVRGMGASRAALVPAEGLAVSMTEVRAPTSRQHILRAPLVGPGPLTRESELALCRHYGSSRRTAELYRRGPGEVTAVATVETPAVSVVA